MNKIVRTALVCGNRNFFIESLQETIDSFQKDLLEVEVQFKTDAEGFYALVIGHDVGEWRIKDIFQGENNADT